MKRAIRKISSGFASMELLIAVAIVAILAGVVIPSYIHYTKKYYFSEVVQLADSYKVAIASCLEERAGVLADCDDGSYGIPANIAGWCGCWSG